MPGDLPDSQNPTVLIVEDADTCATTLELAFVAIPRIRVQVASSAAEAIHILSSAGSRLAALVTDVNMPAMDGFELVRRVRADGRHARLPIIVVSGDTDPQTPQRILQMGADAYFPKPFSPSQVRQKLEQLLDAHRTHSSQ